MEFSCDTSLLTASIGEFELHFAQISSVARENPLFLRKTLLLRLIFVAKELCAHLISVVQHHHLDYVYNLTRIRIGKSPKMYLLLRKIIVAREQTCCYGRKHVVSNVTRLLWLP